MVAHGAVGHVALARASHSHAGGGVGALVVSLGQLPAEPARKADDEVLLDSEVWILQHGTDADTA